MKSFKEFGIKSVSQSLQGDKIKMDRILNREIVIHDYRIEDSKFNQQRGSKCLYIQISISGTKHVVFTGSINLMECIQQVPKEDFPFITTIVKENDRYEFT